MTNHGTWELVIVLAIMVSAIVAGIIVADIADKHRGES